ncbi:hypothetical protein SDC9_184000 [bioreactor metagenome]|uniref:Uncharacterized protein n=1 Tax=bioreactor metagenome TaxID=1076179 RepID=A0A645HBS4_9ZZZZ
MLLEQLARLQQFDQLPHRLQPGVEPELGGEEIVRLDRKLHMVEDRHGDSRNVGFGLHHFDHAQIGGDEFRRAPSGIKADETFKSAAQFPVGFAVGLDQRPALAQLQLELLLLELERGQEAPVLLQRVILGFEFGFGQFQLCHTGPSTDSWARIASPVHF